MTEEYDKSPLVMKPSQHHGEISKTDVNDAAWFPAASLQHNNNKLHSVMFYASLPLTDIQLSRVTLKMPESVLKHDK